MTARRNRMLPLVAALGFGCGWVLVACGGTAATGGTAVPALRASSSSASATSGGDLSAAAAAYAALAKAANANDALQSKYQKDVDANDLPAVDADLAAAGQGGARLPRTPLSNPGSGGA